MTFATTGDSRRVRVVPWLVLGLVGLGMAVIWAGAAGALVNRGGGPGAARHELPPTAIDTDQLPHTRLSAENPQHAPLPLYRLAQDTYFLYGNIATINPDNRGFNGNAGFVVTDQGVVIIDALGTPRLGRRLIATVRTITNQPIRYLILTHHHPDHAYGASAFRDIEGLKIIGHRGTIEYLGSETMQRSVEYRKELLPEDMIGFKAVEPDLYVPEERFTALRFELGGKAFAVYNAGEHHSHGDLVVHQVEQGIVWISDLAFNQRVTYMGDGDSEKALEGQEWLLRKFADARLMVPGHGSAQTPPFPMVQKTRDYIQALRARMKEKVQAGVPLLDAVQDAEMGQWAEMPLYDENQRANASFIYREMEFEFF